MTRFWLHRPQLLHLAIFFAAYVLGCGFAQALAIVPGITVSIWPPGGVFIATLVLTSPYSWPWWILAGCLAEMFAQLVWFHSPPLAGFLIFVGNAMCATVGAALLNRICGRPIRLETLGEVLAFVALGAGVAPLVSATVGSATLAWFGVESQTFTAVWPLFWIGDATGILLVAPLALVAIQHWRGKTTLSAAQWTEAGILALIFLGVAALSLSAHYLPTPYIIMPALLWAAARFEFRGAAVALALLALITMALTISGDSQFVGDPESQRQRQVMLQFFLVISAFSALIVAAISRQHQQTVLALRQSERQLQQMIDAVPVRIWSVKPSGGPVYFNKRYKDHFRTVTSNFDALPEQGIEDLVQNLAHPDDASRVQATLRNCFETGDASAMRFRWREKDGDYRWAECRVAPRRDEVGSIAEWYGVSIDVDEEVRAQEALRERERELSQLVDLVPIHIRRLTPQGEPIFFNKRLMDFFGLGDVTELDKPGMSRLATLIQTLVHSDDAAELLSLASSSFASGKPFSKKYRMRRADGVYRWVDTRAEPLRNQGGTIVQWYVVSLDVDDEVRAQQDLKERERELRELVDVVPVAISCMAPDGQPTFFNKRLIDLIGLDVKDLEKPGISRLSAAVAATMHPEDAPAITEAFSRALRAGAPFSLEYRRRHANSGEYRWVENRVVPLINAEGAVQQWYGVSIDIDDQRRLYKELEERDARIRRLIDSDVLGIVFWDLDGTLIDANDAFLRMVQYDRDDLKAGLDWFAMTPPEWQEVHASEEAAELMSTGKMQAREKEYFRKDGSRVPILIGAVCFEENHRQGIAYILDLTERKRTEEALRQASGELAKATQAASLAELSASIAHEVNQPLAAIVANSQACLRWLSAESPNIERAKITAERITRDANAAAQVVSRIRALFKQSAETRTNATLGGVISEARNLMAEEAARRRVRIDLDIGSDLPSITLDRIQIQQVLVNLMRNGIEAMEAVAGERSLGVRVRRMGDSVQTEVIDRGPGVEHPDRMFEPFFTTKEQGMGMGLAISRSIVESHGGRLWVEGNGQSGATFIFTLPVEAKAAA